MDLRRPNRLPVILQSEASECGLACIAMIAGFHGRSYSLPELRQQYAISLRGAGLKLLLKIAAGVGLAGRPLRIDLHELKRLQCPALLHWDLDHYVVLRRIDRRGRAIVHNPALGVRRYGAGELSRHFSGIAVELSPRAGFKPRVPTPGLSLRSLTGGLRNLWPALLQILLLSGLIQCFALAAPFYLQLVVDDVLVKHNLHLLWVLAAGFGLLLLIRVATRSLRDWIGQHAAVSLGIGMAASLFQHLLRLPSGYFAHRRSGDVASRFESVKPVQAFLTGGAISAGVDGVLAVTTLVMMLLYSPLLSLIVLVSFAVYLLLRMATFTGLKVRSQEAIGAGALADSQFLETLHAIPSIRAAGREAEVGGIWLNRLAAARSADLKVARLQIGFDAGHGLITGLENVLVVFAGAHAVLEGELTIGMLYAFVAFKNHFGAALTALIDESLRYRMLTVHLERIADITQTPAEQGLLAESGFSVRRQGAVDLSGLWYRYGEGEPYVLQDFNMTVPEGEWLCLQGPSGCGKSTVLKLAAGLLNPEQGEVRIAGQLFTGAGIRQIREGIATITEADVLLSGSIIQNVTFFDLQPDLAAVESVCQLAEIHADILAMPMGYETRLGQLGSVLSAGQQQRLLLARALYRRPWLLLLDEATAHLDGRTERRVLDNLREMSLTCLFTSHAAGLPSELGVEVRQMG
ncbi:MAG: peptidase domain-containing ABC transporter [Pseudomonadales bacterium]